MICNNSGNDFVSFLQAIQQHRHDSTLIVQIVPEFLIFVGVCEPKEAKTELFMVCGICKVKGQPG